LIVVAGPDQPGPPKDGDVAFHLSGDVWSYIALPQAEGVLINTVCFAPGARTFWHVHERGQILQVLAGRGLVQTAHQQAVVLLPSATVWSPPGEWHWHGAVADSYMTHVAISLGEVTWLNEVDADAYVVALRGDMPT